MLEMANSIFQENKKRILISFLAFFVLVVAYHSIKKEKKIENEYIPSKEFKLA